MAAKKSATTTPAAAKKAAPGRTTGPTKKVVSAPAKKAVAAPAKKAVAAPAKNVVPAKKAAPAENITSSEPASRATKAAPVKKSAPAAKAAPAKKTSAKSARSSAGSAVLRVRGTETPWTAKEIRETRAELESERAKAIGDLHIAEADLQGLLREAGEGAGDDQADAGASIGGRDYEMTLAAGTRDKLDQIEHALERLADGSYGMCETCGNAIGKLRLQAAPRATLCVDCKIKQESR